MATKQQPAPQAEAPVPYPPEGYQVPVSDSAKTLGIISIIGAFVFTPVGLILGIIGMAQAKKFQQQTNQISGGKTTSLVGTILSAVMLVLSIVMFMVMISIGIIAVSQAADENGGISTGGTVTLSGGAKEIAINQTITDPQGDIDFTVNVVKAIVNIPSDSSFDQERGITGVAVYVEITNNSPECSYGCEFNVNDTLKITANGQKLENYSNPISDYVNKNALTPVADQVEYGQKSSGWIYGTSYSKFSTPFVLSYSRSAVKFTNYDSDYNRVEHTIPAKTAEITIKK